VSLSAKDKRYGSVAVLLNLLAPGAGFLYAGSWRLALLTFFCLFSLIILMGGSRFILNAKGLLSIFVVIVATYLLSTLATFFLARKAGRIRVNKGQYWIVYGLFIAISLWCAVALFAHRTSFLGYSVYLLPSKSMAATLLPHDYIMVDTWLYQQEEPQKGDIVVFRYAPKPTALFIKRVIAVGGDSVKTDKGRVFVNGRVIQEPYVLTANNIKTMRKPSREWTVPKGHYFVLGDNRDSSNDSRYWGFVKRDAIHGKAISIWFSYATEGGFRVRKERLGKLY